MKILIVAMRAFALSRSRIALIKQLQMRGWEVVAACEGGSGEENLRGVGVDVRSIDFNSGVISPAGLWALGRGLRKIVAEEKPDMMHVFNALPIILSGVFLGGVRPPVVLNTVTGLGRGYGKGGVSGLAAMSGYGLSLTQANYSVCQNTADHKILLRRFSWLKERLGVIIGSGVDTSLFRPLEGVPDDLAPCVLMVSRLMWSKGVGEFVEMAKAVGKQFPTVRFQLAGELVADDPDGVPEDWIQREVVAGTIEFIGYLSNLHEVLPSAAVVVHPTKYREGVPRIVMEAGSCGVPVVTTHGPGNDDIVVDGHTGVLYNSSEVGELQAAVSEMLANPARAHSMGKKAREHISSNYDIALVNEAYLALYDQLAGVVGK
jgi:glycosyltransferase involved in cell wall biosynthesis